MDLISKIWSSITLEQSQTSLWEKSWSTKPSSKIHVNWYENIKSTNVYFWLEKKQKEEVMKNGFQSSHRRRQIRLKQTVRCLWCHCIIFTGVKTNRSDCKRATADHQGTQRCSKKLRSKFKKEWLIDATPASIKIIYTQRRSGTSQLFLTFQLRSQIPKDIWIHERRFDRLLQRLQQSINCLFPFETSICQKFS